MSMSVTTLAASDFFSGVASLLLQPLEINSEARKSKTNPNLIIVFLQNESFQGKMGDQNISRCLSGTVSYQKHFPENTQYITDFD
jgi:hypothetical protein